MSDIPRLIKQLKRSLKRFGLTYQDVANQLDLSEASVKRLFSQHHFTLERLEQVCRLMGMTLTELIIESERQRNKVEMLSLEQEEYIVSDYKLLLVTYLTLNRWSFDEIILHYSIEPLELIQLLAQLDRMKIIELLPNNAIRLLTAPHFRWIKNGPIETFVLRQVKDEFLNSRFDKPEEAMRFVSGLLSDNTFHSIRKKIDLFEEEVFHLIEQDSKLPLEERKGFSVLFALRFWDFEAFSRLKRQ